MIELRYLYMVIAVTTFVPLAMPILGISTYNTLLMLIITMQVSIDEAERCRF